MVRSAPGALRHGGEGKTADVHGHAEIVRRGVDIAALELVLVGKGDGMDDEVQAVPHLGQFGKGGVDRLRPADVAIDQGGGLEGLDQRHHPLAEQIALIGKSELGAGVMQSLGNAPGNGMLIGDPHDQATFALHVA